MRIFEIGRSENSVEVDLVERVRREQGGKNSKERDGGQHRRADHRRAVALEPRQRILPERAAGDLLGGYGGGGWRWWRKRDAGHFVKPGRSVIADLRIKQSIDQIDEEVEQDDERPVEDNDAHDQSVIAVERAL